MSVIQTNPLSTWKTAATATELHDDFPQWIETAFSHLDHHCSQVGFPPLNAEDLEQDPTASDLAKHICQHAKAMLSKTLNLACSEWWSKFNQTLIAPLKQQIKEAETEAKALKEEITQLGTQKADQRRTKVTVRLATLKADIKTWKATIKAITEKGNAIRKAIEAWKCPDSETWEPWLATQPIYDQISSLDDRRTPPQPIAEFIAQESTYTPDLNDGVRVNIAPLQRSGLLANDVLAAKDVNKAIGDRAEWRADERRWCREGKLPQPGWWKIDTKVDIL
ncbi:hypothetical protein [Phormidesmis priestleyi]|uniref:hypothetical protein n=1 Tax=Phormidesmis priestleyi TaxID=268141 RepID=UPI000932C8BE|nr:hypothetical protein [Phormidesmis priestleyi]